MNGFAIRSYGTVQDRKLTFKDGLAVLGKRDQKKLANNTYLVRVDDDTLGVRLHNTIVVYIHKSGNYSLDTGGWRTVTTKDRINSYSPARVHQVNNIWYVGDHGIYADGVTVDKTGKPTSKLRNPGEVERKKRKLDRIVRSYVKGFAEHAKANGLYVPGESEDKAESEWDVVKLGPRPVPLKPGPGDCFLCQFRAEDNREVQVDHLLAHFGLGEDGEVYYVPSLLRNAIANTGNPPYVWAMLAHAVKRGRTDLLENYLTGYFRKLKPALLEAFEG
jgi:hypothetical protein